MVKIGLIGKAVFEQRLKRQERAVWASEGTAFLAEASDHIKTLLCEHVWCVHRTATTEKPGWLEAKQTGKGVRNVVREVARRQIV